MHEYVSERAGSLRFPTSRHLYSRMLHSPGKGISMDENDCGKRRRCLIEESRLELEEAVKVPEEYPELKATTKSPIHHGNTV